MSGSSGPRGPSPSFAPPSPVDSIPDLDLPGLEAASASDSAAPAAIEINDIGDDSPRYHCPATPLLSPFTSPLARIVDHFDIGPNADAPGRDASGHLRGGVGVEMEDNNENEAVIDDNNENDNEAEMDDTQPVSGPSPTAGLAAKVNPPKGGKGKTGQSKAGAKQAAQGKSVGASGLGKGKGYGAARHTKKKRKTKTFRAGLLFPVGRMKRYLKNSRIAKRVSDGAAVYLAGVVEYLAAELLELAGNAARDNGRIRIIPRHVLLAIRQDPELDTFIGHEVIIPMSGVMPNIHVALLPAAAPKKSVVQPAGAPGAKAQSGGAAGAKGSSTKKSKAASSKGSSKGAGKGKVGP